MNIIRASALKDKTWLKYDLDDGIYKEAASKGVSPSVFLEQLKHQEVGSIYAGLTFPEMYELRKSMRERGENPPPLAINELLAAAGLNQGGRQSDRMRKFWEIPDLQVLIPAWIQDRVYIGLLADSLVRDFVFEEQVVDALDFYKIYFEDSETDLTLKETAMGAEAAETTFRLSRQGIQLKKYMRALNIPYEVLEMQTVNAVATALNRIGAWFNVHLTDNMFYTLFNGDGNGNTPGTTVESDISGNLDIEEMVKWANCAPTPYRNTIYAGRKVMMNKVGAVLATMNNAQIQFSAAGVSLPSAREWDRDVIKEDELIGVDRRYAIGAVTTGAIMTENDKFINKQINQAVISFRGAFQIADPNAVFRYDLTH